MIKQNILANYLGQSWSALMGIAFIPVYIRYLGIEAYGLIGLFTVMQAWISLLDMGITPTLNREMARFTAGAHSPQSIHNLLRSLEMICYSLAACIATGVWGASGYISNDWLKAEHLPGEVVTQAITIIAFVIAFRFCEGIYRGALFGLQRQVWYNAAQAILATVRHGGAAFLLVWIVPSVKAFFIWQAVMSLLTVIVYAVRLRYILPEPPSRPRFSFEAMSGVWIFAGGMAWTALLSLILTQADKVILSRLISLELFGYYAMAATVTGALSIVTSPVALAAYPRMVELSTQDDQEGLICVYHKAAQLVTILTAPIAMILAFFGGGVVFMWSGDAGLADSTAPIISVLVVGTFLNSLMIIPYMLQIAHGWNALAIKTNVVAVVLLIPAFFWIVPVYGAVGAAWIWVALNSGYILISIQFMHARLIPSEKWRWYFTDILLPVSGALIVIVIAQFVQPTGYQARFHWLVFLLVAGGLAMAASTVLADCIRPQILAIVLKAGRHTSRWLKAA